MGGCFPDSPPIAHLPMSFCEAQSKPDRKASGLELMTQLSLLKNVRDEASGFTCRFFVSRRNVLLNVKTVSSSWPCRFSDPFYSLLKISERWILYT